MLNFVCKEKVKVKTLPFAELTEDMKNRMRDLREKFYKGETL